MAIFGEKKRPCDCEEQQNRIRGEQLTLEARVAALESGQRLMGTEWAEVHDQIKRMLARMSARARWDVEKPSGEAISEPSGPPRGFDLLAAQRLARARRNGG